VRQEAARAWSVWEARTSFLLPKPDYVARSAGDAFSLAFARIECHYFVNRGFLTHEDQLLDDVETIRHVPAVIVQGRYDVVCPAVSAYELWRRWPEAKLVVVDDAGHSAYEPGILSALVEATDRFAR
jgi:proline iminopeptidase